MSNTVTTLVPKILEQGLLALREQAIMPRLVRRLDDSAAQNKGDKISVPLPATLVVTNVTPGVAIPSPQNATPKVVDVTLSQWKRSDFHLTDKEFGNIAAEDAFIPMQVSDAIRNLANGVDSYIFGKYTGVYAGGGIQGTTPFATNLSEFKDARRLINKMAAPFEDRRVVLDADAEANALILSSFLAADERGDQGGIISGQIGRKLGCDWYLDQNVPTHTAGTWFCSTTSNGEFKAQVAADVSTFILKAATTTTSCGGSLKVGDVFFVTGDSLPYVVKTAGSVAAGASATLSVNIAPVLRATIAAAATIKWGDSGTLDTNNRTPDNHVVNLLFHRDAFAFASRPMRQGGGIYGSTGGMVIASETAVDSVSGLALRLQVLGGYKQVVWDFDILYGAALIRPELAARIYG